jgi:poly(hydroxyalkanoate) granule-associated protein
MHQAIEETPTPAYGAADRLNEVRIRGRKLWLAGLGALGTIVDLDQESRGLFDRLVERGRPVSHRQKQVAQEIGDRAAGRIREMRERVRGQVREDLQRVLRRADVPTREEWNALTAHLEALSRKIDEIA